MFIALMMIETLRMIGEVLVYSATRKQLFICRIFLLSVCGMALGGAAFWMYAQWQAQLFSNLISVQCLKTMGTGIMQIPETPLGLILLAPMRILADIMIADQISLLLAAKVIGSILVFFGSINLLIWADRQCAEYRNRQEKSAWTMIVAKNNQAPENSANATRRRWRPPHWNGIGSLAWRQWLGVVHYRTTIAIALSVPFMLSCLPAFNSDNDIWMIANVVGGLVFYSFLLLPTTLKFDFRRDIDRMNILKAMPMKPSAIACGQLLVPVLVTTIFQLTVLAIVAMVNPYSIALMFAALVILIPINIFIFGLENLIFLLYPYRVNKEGIQVFLRSILTFTAKGLLFGFALACALALLLLAQSVGPTVLQADAGTGTFVIFAFLLWLSISLSAGIVFWLLTKTFARIDPSQDLADVV
jgi:hypothetical protein